MIIIKLLVITNLLNYHQSSKIIKRPVQVLGQELEDHGHTQP